MISPTADPLQVPCRGEDEPLSKRPLRSSFPAWASWLTAAAFASCIVLFVGAVTMEAVSVVSWGSVSPAMLSLVADPACRARVAGAATHGSAIPAPLTLWSSIDRLWEAGSYRVAVWIVFWSGVWPFVKAIAQLGLWFAPMQRRAQKRTATVLALFARWALVDVFILCVLLVGFRFTLVYDPTLRTPAPTKLHFGGVARPPPQGNGTACRDDPTGAVRQAGASCALLLSLLHCGGDLHSLAPDKAPPGAEIRLICPESCGFCGNLSAAVRQAAEAAGRFTGCRDDVGGYLGEVGLNCSLAAPLLGCGTALGPLLPGVPEDTIVSSLCTQTCGCPSGAGACADDPAALLGSHDYDCSRLGRLGCCFDLRALRSDVPSGSWVWKACRSTCHACTPQPPCPDEMMVTPAPEPDVLAFETRPGPANWCFLAGTLMAVVWAAHTSQASRDPVSRDHTRTPSSTQLATLCLWAAAGGLTVTGLALPAASFTFGGWVAAEGLVRPERRELRIAALPRDVTAAAGDSMGGAVLGATVWAFAIFVPLAAQCCGAAVTLLLHLRGMASSQSRRMAAVLSWLSSFAMGDVLVVTLLLCAHALEDLYGHAAEEYDCVDPGQSFVSLTARVLPGSFLYAGGMLFAYLASFCLSRSLRAQAAAAVPSMEMQPRDGPRSPSDLVPSPDDPSTAAG